MKVGNKIYYIAFTLIVVVIILWYLPGMRYYPDVTVDKMKEQIEKDVPIGSSLNDVIKYLQDLNIEFSYVKESNKIYAIRRNVCRGILIECSIDMVFEFNDQGKLSKFTAKEGLTGL